MCLTSSGQTLLIPGEYFGSDTAGEFDPRGPANGIRASLAGLRPQRPPARTQKTLRIRQPYQSGGSFVDGWSPTLASDFGAARFWPRASALSMTTKPVWFGRALAAVKLRNYCVGAGGNAVRWGVARARKGYAGGVPAHGKAEVQMSRQAPVKRCWSPPSAVNAGLR